MQKATRLAAQMNLFIAADRNAAPGRKPETFVWVDPYRFVPAMSPIETEMEVCSDMRRDRSDGWSYRATAL